MQYLLMLQGLPAMTCAYPLVLAAAVWITVLERTRQKLDELTRRLAEMETQQKD